MTYLRKYKILLVDDNEVFLKALKLQLNDILPGQIEFIDEAHDGLEAIACTKKKKYHVVFMDIEMPNMNGIEATRYINVNYPYIWIVALTLYNDFHYMEKMLKAGARTYMLKDKLDDNALLNVFKYPEKYS